MLPHRTLDVTLDLKDPQYPENNLGSLDLAVTVSPKEGDVKDAVRNLYELLFDSFYSFTSLFLLAQTVFVVYSSYIIFDMSHPVSYDMPDILQPDQGILKYAVTAL